MDGLSAQGLVRMDARRIEVTPLGRLLVRRVAMPFDRYLREDRRAPPAAVQPLVQPLVRMPGVAMPAVPARYSRVV